MGIKHLNRFFLDNCKKKSIYKTHLKSFSGKTIVVDTSIYLYKYALDNAIVENMFLLISIFKKYNIEPIFVFDGKPPPEKKTLLIQRRIEKLDAEKKYVDMKSILDNGELIDAKKQKLLLEMEQLKRQFIRITDSDIKKAKNLMDAYGVAYYDADGEADVLCSYFLKTGDAWACISDDMDMFLYGCKRVIRHLSVLNHTAVLYDTESILSDLNMNQDMLRDILILSGTDYNINGETNLFETIKWFNEYDKYCKTNNTYMNFYDWLKKYTKYIKDISQLEKVKSLFYLDNRNDLLEKINNTEKNDRNVDMDSMIQILKEEGFLFIH
jgi:5'-3' exonuclease